MTGAELDPVTLMIAVDASKFNAVLDRISTPTYPAWAAEGMEAFVAGMDAVKRAGLRGVYGLEVLRYAAASTARRSVMHAAYRAKTRHRRSR